MTEKKTENGGWGCNRRFYKNKIVHSELPF